MSSPNRKQLMNDLMLAGQRNGNLNVLFTNAVSQKVGLSATEFECYSLLQDEGAMTSGKLSKLCGLTTGGLTGLVDRLEKLGFVKRSADPKDRRKVLVSAQTDEEIKQKLGQLYGPLAKNFGDLAEQYTDEQLEFLVKHYQKVGDIFAELTLRLGEHK